MVLLKSILLFLCFLAICRVGFSGVPYFSNYPFSHHHRQEGQEADYIKEQNEKAAKDRSHRIDIMDLHGHKKRDLIEELERIEVQKQIEKDRNRPNELEMMGSVPVEPEEINIQTNISSTPMEQIPQPEDTMEQGKDKKEGKRVQDFPSKPEGIETVLEDEPLIAPYVPPHQKEPISVSQFVEKLKVEDRLKLKKRDINGVGL